MESTSASSIPKSFKYDVFLSFRGEDTRKNFVDHLYHALHSRGITTYKDDMKIEKGKRIDDQLMRSIEDSRIYIIVFSKNYASSSWCLDELVKIMECQKMTGQTAYPIFFNVEPTEVRHQSGAVKQAFAKHEKEEAAGKWRHAMKEAADLAGRELKTTFDGHEARFIQTIVEDISLELRFIDLSVDEKLVGMETRVKDVVSYLEDASVDVHMIGIKGIGGGGKTTLATAVFNHISDSFEGKSFVENVREVSKGSGLKELQKQVLKDVLNDKNIDVTSVHEGKNKMKKMMCSRKVLVVLDDVDEMEQLEALAPDHTWFKSGSTIIITTRDEEVLVAHRVKFIHDVNLLSHEEGIRLFSKYAFGREIPIKGYEELARKVVYYADGLPLTIKVLGSSLCGKTECEWNDAIERLKTIPEKQTLKRLELSYSGLEHDQKEVFLEVACILKGELKDKAIRILESCGFHARIALKVLEQKSLITVSNYDCLNMHDRIEEMGRNIVRRLHPREPQKHNRLWVKEEIENILVNELGTKATLSIKLMSTNLHLAIILKGLRKMKKLRVLYISGQNWSPDLFRENKLKMGCSNIFEQWEGGDREVLKELKFLGLNHSKLRTFDLGLTPQLETLDLTLPVESPKLNSPFLNHSKLKSLDLRYSMVSKLDLGLSSQLETLDLRGCNALIELCMPIESPKLKSLDLGGSKLSKLDLGLTPQLERLNLMGCNGLVELHMPVESPKLKSLDASGSKLNKLDLGLTPQLKTLDLKGCNELVELHMGLTPQLETLDLRGCNELVELHMPVQSPKLKCLYLSGSKLSKLDLGLTPQLERLNLRGCNDFVELYMPVECSKLNSLNLSGSKVSVLNLGHIPYLVELSLEGCNEFLELHIPVECPNLKSLNLSDCKMSNLNLGLTPHLQRLFLEGCNEFVKLHMPVECPDLKHLYLSDCKVKKFNVGLTPNLETLSIARCSRFKKLHMPVECPKLKSIDLRDSKVSSLNIGLTPHLEWLYLAGCIDLLELHMPVECPKLKYLNLNHCKVSSLNLGLIAHLERLYITRCNDFVEIHMPVKCPKLKFINLCGSKVSTLNLGMTPHLKVLLLQGCNEFVDLHMPVECPMLKYLDLSDCKLGNLNLGLIPHLETLILAGCNEFVELHMPIVCPMLKYLDLSYCKIGNFNLGQTPHLETLFLAGCNELVELHMPVECPKLKSLDLSHSKVSDLNLGLTPHLETLVLKGCSDFVELNMPDECLKLKFLNLSGSKVSKLNLGLTPHLERLDFKECCYLQEIHAPVGCLENVVYLNLSRCLRFEYFCVAKGYQPPRLSLVPTWLELTAESIDTCPLHPDNNLPKFQFKCSYDEPLPTSSGNIEKLISFGLCACTNLESFSATICGLQRLRKLTLEGSIPEAPKDLYRLESLEELTLSMKEIKYLPDSICMLKHLKTLKLRYCHLLEQLPKDIGRLESLEELHLTDCISLREIPNRICDMKRLKYLDLRFCILVEKLPEEFGRLESLEELNIEGAGISRLPHSIFELKGLYIVGSRWRLESYGFTSLNEISTYTASCYIRDSQYESPL